MAIKSIRIERNSANIARLLKSEPFQAELEKRARRIAAAAAAAVTDPKDDGEPFEARVYTGPGTGPLGRAMAVVSTSNMDGRRAEASTRALTRAIDAGRG